MTTARFLRRPANFLLDLLTTRRVEGRQYLPAGGPCIVVANHLSFLDAVLVFALVGGEDLTGWAAEKWENNVVFGTFLRLGNAFFIQRGQVDREAIERAADWLRAGKIFGMAPEGTRSLDGGLGRAKPGVAYLANLVPCPVVPIAHWGTETTWSAWLRLRRPHIEVRVGPSFHLPPLDPEDRSGSLRRNADEVMCHLAALMPPERRGAYADHPRLRAILAAR
ncbi:MAG TPA: lysophospholipid acyltransferase family protein [Anaerolineales bacterium]|nr:lysophospholipid acyltransferase family protein [Anaerolineales bacterium]